ncbi:MAG: DNA mismatch repair protein MutS [Clostridia bacterium]|nr:DNA mismatch repair protein MutS [Clostridia bacterium]MDD6040460.1 DNA mismatch repair protein MutS [Clostridia bacterium]
MALTAMMQQYLQLKEKYKDCILFFRLGDFYEMFFEDAKLVSKELELTLTGKDCGLEERAPMCGVPYHAASTYCARLIEKGYKVAICEQLTDPALSKGLVERDVIRIITPGTVVDPAQLDEKSASYVLCVAFIGKTAQLAYADVSTGELTVHQLLDAEKTLRDELMRIRPHEIVTNNMDRLTPELSENVSSTQLPETAFQPRNARQAVMKQFQVQSLSSLGLDERDKRFIAAGALLSYLSDTQRNALCHITQLSIYQGSNAMFLDRMTRRNLELTESLRTGERRGSLLWLLDQTHTAMGARLLRTWVESPMTDASAIQSRLDAVEAFCNRYMQAEEIGEALEQVADMERLLGKISYNSLTARDCLALLRSLRAVAPVKQMLEQFAEIPVQALAHTLTPLETLCDLLDRAIDPDAPLTVGDGGVIRKGYHAELDEYREALENGKQWILDMETAERQETGIKNLKIQYNRVFGYYIDVTKSNLNLVPLRYTRRQTLANSERYVTPELQEIERKITNAQQMALSLEMELFGQVREAIAREIGAIQQNALALKTTDALLSLATVARENDYVKPTINQNGVLHIVEGRHPIVERMVSDAPFVPNDVTMDPAENRMLIITGPNMAGKSTYMRQVALITLMAHIGSFVPAREADISLCDRIFTRIGASDDLAGGQSTFMVEMSETAAILRNATEKSLVILDEIGRGTSTFDGLAIAWAVVEYLLDPKKIGAKTLFATHYHELSELEGRFAGVKNYCISVVEHGEDVIFLRKIMPGGADKSYGVHVARLAGVPAPVVARAHEIQARLEVSDINQESISANILEKKKKEARQTDMFHLPQDDLIEELRNLDVLSVTPMDALNILFRLREKARRL